MLALTRKSGEGIILTIDGEQVARIVVQNCKTGSTQVLIDAGQEVRIHREEISRATGAEPIASHRNVND